MYRFFLSLLQKFFSRVRKHSLGKGQRHTCARTPALLPNVHYRKEVEECANSWKRSKGREYVLWEREGGRETKGGRRETKNKQRMCKSPTNSQSFSIVSETAPMMGETYL